MKTSAIRHPEGSYFIRRCDWQIKALETAKTGEEHPKRSNDTETAAEIMSIMEYHFNNKLANRILRSLIDKAMGEQGRHLDEIGDWQPYSVAYINELLMNGRSPGLITKSLELLVDRGFLSVDVPAHIPTHYSANYTWYKLEVDLINDWIDKNITKSWIEQVAESKERQGKKTKGEKPVDAKTKIVNTITEYYRQVHAKNVNYVIDTKRKNAVVKRLNEKRTPAQCAQAIIGNLKSDWHQGRDENNSKVFDDIELIFRNAKTFEAHLQYAIEAGISEQDALNDLEAFLRGEVSRYAKKPKKAAQNASNSQPEASQDRPVNARQYLEFARSISAFFATGDVETKEIIEFCVTNNSLKELSIGLVDPDYLTGELLQGIKTFQPQGADEAMIAQVKEFAGTFCKLQQINGG